MLFDDTSDLANELAQQHNADARYKFNRMPIVINLLKDLINNFDDKKATIFLSRFGYDLRDWLEELLQRWKKDKNIQFHTPYMYDPPPEKPPQEVNILDMMKINASFGEMAAWDMARNAGKPWLKGRR